MTDRTIISARTLLGVQRIDAGNTLALQFEEAGGGKTSILVPVAQAISLNAQISAALDDDPARVRDHTSPTWPV